MAREGVHELRVVRARLEEEEHPCEGLVRVGHGDDLVVDVGVGQARLECVLRR